MYKVGDYLVYKKNVCIIKNILEKVDDLYYQLIPIDDDSLKIEVAGSKASDFFKNIISKEEVNNLISTLPDIDVIDCEDRFIEYEYKQLLESGTKEDLIKLIKTTYLRNKCRIENKKRKSLKDSEYQEKAEKILYTELSVALNLTIDETREYFINKVEEMVA